MNGRPAHPVIVLLASHWASMLGAALVTTAAISWLLLGAFPGQRASENPYLGLLVFFAIPAVFFAGLILMPVGVWLAKRRVQSQMEGGALDRAGAIRRIVIFLAVTTLANLIFASQFTYRAVEHMETVGFCGQSCHVMDPQFRAFQASTHSKVGCVECHVAPGAAGWVEAKMSGTRQLYEVLMNSHPRPVPAGLASNRLVASAETCERCHARGHALEPRVKVKAKFAEDEANTATYTVMMMRVREIHGAHMGGDVEIRYAPAGAARESIPVVEWKNRKTGETREYRAGGDSKNLSGTARIGMQCVDCHNRPGHRFDAPDAALDRAMASGDISPRLPGVKKRSLALLNASYASREEAGAAIRKSILADFAGKPEAKRAAEAVAGIYERNVFPEFKVTWGTYPDHLGHTNSPGCFRCHDGEHSAAGGKSLGQDCASCHEMLAVEEADPEILKKLNLSLSTKE